MGELLSVKNINVYYGSIHAIKDVSFHVDEGEIVTLIGANGAGKTTTMHAISGLLKLASGEITYDGNLISKMEAHKIVRLGLAQVPEGRRVFSGLTVQQNLSWVLIPATMVRMPSRAITTWCLTCCPA